MENNDKMKETFKSKDFSQRMLKGNNSHNKSKSSKSPCEKDKFTKHIRHFNKIKNFESFNEKNLSISNDNISAKKEISEIIIIGQIKDEKSQISDKENYKSENEFIKNSNVNTTKSPKSKYLSREFSENFVYTNKIKPKNILNNTNRDYGLNMNNILSERNRIIGNNSKTINNANNIQNSTSSNGNIEKKQPPINLIPKSQRNYYATNNLNYSTKNLGISQHIKSNSIYYTSKNNKNINGNSYNSNINTMIGNNINLSLNFNKIPNNLGSISGKRITTDNKGNLLNLDYLKNENSKIKEGLCSTSMKMSKNGLISYLMKPNGDENKLKNSDYLFKNKVMTKEISRPKSATLTRALLKK